MDLKQLFKPKLQCGSGPMTHAYLPNSPPHVREEMLREVGVTDIEELYLDVPREARFRGKFTLPQAMSEAEIELYFRSLWGKNRSVRSLISFLGAGCWDHHIPAIVREVMSRAEFFTSYTQYQPEISQGMLQALFEFQSLIAELTEMDVSNSSLYDWPTALGEAALMCARITRRKKILVSYTIHPDRLAVLKNYAAPLDLKVERVEYNTTTGQLQMQDLKSKIDEDTAALYIENPSYLGFLEDQVDEIASATHQAGALLIAGVNLLSLGVVRPPGDYEADIVVSEGQPLGIPMSFGGPSLGILATRGEARFVHQVPGRIIGQTTTLDGSKRGYTMVLQSREQHIRREKATSNICTNEALVAVGVAAFLASLGPRGLRSLAERIMSNVQYAISRFSAIKGVRVPRFEGSHFEEFVVDFADTGFEVEQIHSKMLRKNVHGGRILKKDFPELGESALYCVSELHTRESIDKAVDVMEQSVKGE